MSKKSTAAERAARRAARQEALDRLADEDARMMQLAGACSLDEPDPAAVLYAPPPGPPPVAYTIPEFCRLFGGFSVASFHRYRKQGLTPAITEMFGQPRILQESIDEWKARLTTTPPTNEEAILVQPGGGLRPASAARASRAKRASAAAHAGGTASAKGPDLFDAPAPEKARKLRSV